jgi:hypothetical protein
MRLKDYITEYVSSGRGGARKRDGFKKLEKIGFKTTMEELTEILELLGYEEDTGRNRTNIHILDSKKSIYKILDNILAIKNSNVDDTYIRVVCDAFDGTIFTIKRVERFLDPDTNEISRTKAQISMSTISDLIEYIEE